jgi:hypothetical protein
VLRSCSSSANVARVSDELLKIAISLEIEAAYLAEDAASGRVASAALAGRVKDTLTSDTPRVHLGDIMQVIPPINTNAVKNTKSTAPALRKILEAGWSVRQLTDRLNAAKIKITHAYLGRMLKGEVALKPEIKAAIREITKIKL